MTNSKKFTEIKKSQIRCKFLNLKKDQAFKYRERGEEQETRTRKKKEKPKEKQLENQKKKREITGHKLPKTGRKLHETNWVCNQKNLRTMEHLNQKKELMG